MQTTTVMFSLATVLVLSACGHTADHYRPVLDGPAQAGYQADLADCQQRSRERSYWNDNVKTNALVGAGIGAALGAAEDGDEGAVGGALVGGAAAAVGKAWETRDERQQIIVECLQQRGHRVVG